MGSMSERKNQLENNLKKMAAQLGVPLEEVILEMQKALDAAWDNPDPEVRAAQKAMFLDGKKPTVEEFILAVTK